MAYTVNISTTTSGAQISYTRDNSIPTPTHGTIVGTNVNVTIASNTSITLQAMAFKSGNSDSGTASGYFDNQNGGGEKPPPGAKAAPASSAPRALELPGTEAAATAGPGLPETAASAVAGGGSQMVTLPGRNPASLWNRPPAAGRPLDLQLGWLGQGEQESGPAPDSGTAPGVYVPNNLNQYTSVGGLTAGYGGNGNLASYNGWNYTYDAMNRLIAVSGPGGVTANFYYDGLGRQVARSGSWTATRTISVWDGWNLAAEFAAGSATPMERLVYGAGGDLVQSPLLDRYYYPEALGSTAYVADGSGGLLESYTYDLGGTPMVYDASAARPGDQ